MKCKKCGSIYGNMNGSLFTTDGCPFCNQTLNPIARYHGGRMEINKIGKIVDAHNRTIHLGVELEVDSFPNEEAKLNCAREVFKTLNKKSKQFVKLERDGSLNNGFEIISQPIQLGSHMNSVKWEEAFNLVKQYGGCSHESGNCGMHVHLEAYNQTFVKNIWNLVNKVYRKELQVFSRRSPLNMRYCAFDNNDYERRTVGHCVAVNTNTSTNCTVEIRIFRGTTNYTTFIETLRLVERLAWLALENECVLNSKMPKFTSLLSKKGKEYYASRLARGGAR